MQLNATKCKKCNHSFEPLFVSDKNLTVVQNAKILGLTISNNLTCNTHIGEIIKKQTLVKDRYLNTVRPCRFRHALPSYHSEDLERIQKRPLNIISPGHRYCDNLAHFGLKTLQSRRGSLCLKLLQSMLNDEGFSNLVPPRLKTSHNLRHSRTFTLPRFRTDRYKRYLI